MVYKKTKTKYSCRISIPKRIVLDILEDELSSIDQKIEELYSKIYVGNIKYNKDNEADIKRYNSLVRKRDEANKLKTRIEKAIRSYIHDED